MGSSLFDVNDIIDVIYVIETVDSNGVSTNCSCLTPDNWFAHHENVTISGGKSQREVLSARILTIREKNTTVALRTVHKRDSKSPIWQRNARNPQPPVS